MNDIMNLRRRLVGKEPVILESQDFSLLPTETRYVTSFSMEDHFSETYNCRFEGGSTYDKNYSPILINGDSIFVDNRLIIPGIYDTFNAYVVAHDYYSDGTSRTYKYTRRDGKHQITLHRFAVYNYRDYSKIYVELMGGYVDGDVYGSTITIRTPEIEISETGTYTCNVSHVYVLDNFYTDSPTFRYPNTSQALSVLSNIQFTVNFDVPNRLCSVTIEY